MCLTREYFDFVHVLCFTLKNGSTKALNPSENPQIGGGGGGGATYVFSATGLSTDNGNDAKDFILHLVAAGGGGLSCNMKEQGLDPDGRGGNIDASINGRSSLDGAGRLQELSSIIVIKRAEA